MTTHTHTHTLNVENVPVAMVAGGGRKPGSSEETSSGMVRSCTQKGTKAGSWDTEALCK